jgi:hypothetical protein
MKVHILSNHQQQVRKVRKEYGKYCVISIPTDMLKKAGIKLSGQVTVEAFSENPFQWQIKIKPVATNQNENSQVC